VGQQDLLDVLGAQLEPRQARLERLERGVHPRPRVDKRQRLSEEDVRVDVADPERRGQRKAMDALGKRSARQPIFFRSMSKISGSLGPIFGGEPVAP
jgi:hypothetical protein